MFQTLADLSSRDLRGKKVLLRADLNVPAEQGRVSDTARIDKVKPTIDALARLGAKIIVLSHFGRPKGTPSAALSLAFLAPVLEERWGRKVSFAADCVGVPAEKICAALKEGEVALLENLRFHPGEEANDPDFAARLAALGDLYVNDAFSAAHRAHASTAALAGLLPCAAGLLMQAELEALGRALEHPENPVAALVGGAKISSKISVLNNLVHKVDYLILGGGMANSFLQAQGISIGRSLCEPEMADQARQVMETARRAGCEIILPQDAAIAARLEKDAPLQEAPVDSIPEDMQILDIGPQTIDRISRLFGRCKTLLWNGPMGVFEVPPFDRGTVALAQKAAALTRAGEITSIAGGGDTLAALSHAGVRNDFSYVSTAGGAFLEWLEGKTLPGVAALTAQAPAQAAATPAQEKQSL